MKELKIDCENINKTTFSCAFTGHRFLDESFSLKTLQKEIERLIKEENVNCFYCGMAMGFDLIAGETIVKLKKKYPIKLIACVPFYEQEKYFSVKDKIRYFDLLEKCDERLLVSEKYYKGCLLKRNRYMANKSDFLIAYLRKDNGGTAYTVNYFKQKNPDNIIYV